MSFIADNIAQRDPIVVTVGVTQPSLYDAIALAGQAIEWVGGDTVTFFMRPLLSRSPVVTGAALALIPANSDGTNVQYNWQAADVALEGKFMGWWGFAHSGADLAETPEFPIIITDHGPGYGVQTGVVVDGLAAHMPTTVTALRDDPAFGDRFLQQHADYIKRVVLGQAVTPDLEAEYDPALVEYLSKRTAIRLIGPAKDYWARQYRQVTAQGPGESASYPDMLGTLDSLHERLCRELPFDWLQLQMLVPNLPQLRVAPAPKSSLGDPTYPWNRHRTLDPQDNPRPSVGGPYWETFLP